jgi:hypothetical protein
VNHDPPDLCPLSSYDDWLTGVTHWHPARIMFFQIRVLLHVLVIHSILLLSRKSVSE